MSRLAGEPEPPSHGGVAVPSIAPLLVASALLLFPGPFLVGACCLAAWWLVPAAGGRGRVVKALAGPAVGGWLGLLGLMWFAGKSPLLGSLNAQAALLASFVCSGLAPPSPDLLQQWLVGSWALGVGLGRSRSSWPGGSRAARVRSASRTASPPGRGPARSTRQVESCWGSHPTDATWRWAVPNSQLALVAGTTNAGKSTLVQTWIEGLSQL